MAGEHNDAVPPVPTPEELQDHFDRESAIEPSMQVMAVDADIHFKDGRVFHADADGWGYHPYGLLVNGGRWNDETQERDHLFPYTGSYESIELFFDGRPEATE